MLRWLVGGALLVGCGENPTLPVDAAIGADAPCTSSLSALPNMIDFGSVSVNRSSMATLVIANPAACPTDSLALALGGNHAASFAIASSDCPGQRLATGTMCTVDIRFAPRSTGAKVAELWIDGGAAPLVVPLNAAATTAPHWFLSGSPYTFAPTTAGETSARHRVTVYDYALTSSITVALVGGSPEFGIVANTCAGSPPGGGSATCYIESVFHPTSAGTKSATIEVSSPSEGQLTAVMSGTALPYTAWTISPSLVDFMSVEVNQTSATERFTIANTGSVPSSSTITVSFDGTNATEFGIVANTCSLNALPPGGTCYVDVEFHPTSLGAKTASLELRDSVLGSLSAPMMGSGITTAGSLSIAPSSYDFGVIRIGSRSLPRRFTMTNGGSVATSTSTTAAILGSNPARFSIVADDCTSVATAPGGTCDVWVDFIPLATAVPQSAILHVGDPFFTGVEAGLSGSANTGGGNFTITPASIDFGPPVAAGARQLVTVKNTRATTSPAISTSWAGIDPGSYRLVNDSCAGAMLPMDATCTLEVETTCAAPGVVQHASLRIVGGGDVTVPVKGTVTTGTCP